MTAPRPLVQLIVASTRPGRVGEPIGQWIAARARDRGDLEVEIVDLAEVDLPMFAEPKHPRTGEYTLQSTRDFSATIDRAAGFILVYPEYNHSYNAALKNALDHLNREWAGKPVGLVSYGGVAAGARATIALEPVLLALGTTPLVGAAVPIPFVSQFLEGEGDQRRFAPNDAVGQGTDAMLDALTKRLVG